VEVTGLRQAWDGPTLQVMTKLSPTKAAGAHVSLIAHVTRGELRRELTRIDAGSGFGNRFLWGVRSPFSGEKNLAERIAHLAPRSVQTERERLRPLCSVLGPVKVHRVTVEMVRTCVADRKCANVANKTLNFLVGVHRLPAIDTGVGPGVALLDAFGQSRYDTLEMARNLFPIRAIAIA
jgi:hypothetical protein